LHAEPGQAGWVGKICRSVGYHGVNAAKFGVVAIPQARISTIAGARRSLPWPVRNHPLTIDPANLAVGRSIARRRGHDMTDVTVGAGAASGDFSLGTIAGWLKRPDLWMASGVIGILVILIFPMPPLLLDVMLAVSIISSVMILMTGLFIHKPLEFSSFPTILLIATMLRLSLNLASTRLILSNGHEGTAAAGHVIEAFGNFVMAGNFVIGIIVFAILVIVNFVVITKGSGRIAEVAARFSLDAMPGKQMAIDADLSAGLIDEKVAKVRRKELEDESAFYGAMDGASKFVKGDAIAGLLITFINVIAGLIIGVAQQGMPFAEAAHTYTLLTVGDGLVSQVPALIISTAAGLLVSKAGVTGSADQAMIKQLTGYPKAVGLSAAVMALMSLLPGIPFLPFFGLALLAAYTAYLLSREAKRAAERAVIETAKEEAAASAPPAEEPMASILKIDDLKIELGYGLLPLVQSDGGSDRLTDQIKALRRQLATDMGFVMPSVRILDNVQLQPNQYIIRVKEVEAGQGLVWPAQYMVMDPMGGAVDLPGVHTTEPTFGLPATWVDANLKEEASVRGYTVVDAATVLSTHLTEVLKANTPDLCRGPEASEGNGQGSGRSREGSGAEPDHGLGHPARAPGAADRARVDPRPAGDPGRHRRSDDLHPLAAPGRGTCPLPPRAAALRAICRPRWRPRAHRAVAAMGAGLRRFDHRPGRRSSARHAAVEAVRLHHPGARGLRGCRAHGRSAGAADEPRHPDLRALHRRALSAADAGAEPGRNPSPRPAEDGR
jgi:flagellar biosynthesis protein FlhA